MPTLGATMLDGRQIDDLQRQAIADAVRQILLAVGEDPTREGLSRTPERIAAMYAEVFAGIHADPTAELTTTFDEDHHELVVLRDIQFVSLCEHHLLPFEGVAHVGYLPRGRVVGASKLARVVDVVARRPQIQERMTQQIADALEQGLECAGVGVIVEAAHSCLAMRGVQKTGATLVTSCLRGALETPAGRADFLAAARRAGC